MFFRKVKKELNQDGIPGRICHTIIPGLYE